MWWFDMMTDNGVETFGPFGSEAEAWEEQDYMARFDWQYCEGRPCPYFVEEE